MEKVSVKTDKGAQKRFSKREEFERKNEIGPKHRGKS